MVAGTSRSTRVSVARRCLLQHELELVFVKLNVQTWYDRRRMTSPTGQPERGILLRCAWCRHEQKIAYTNNTLAMTRAEGLMLLCLATGGRDGSMPPGFPPFKSAVGTPSQIGKSECCDVQIEGELYGEWPEA